METGVSFRVLTPVCHLVHNTDTNDVYQSIDRRLALVDFDNNGGDAMPLQKQKQNKRSKTRTRTYQVLLVNEVDVGSEFRQRISALHGIHSGR